jgi:hypothetical protein
VLIPLSSRESIFVNEARLELGELAVDLLDRLEYLLDLLHLLARRLGVAQALVLLGVGEVLKLLEGGGGLPIEGESGVLDGGDRVGEVAELELVGESEGLVDVSDLCMNKRKRNQVRRGTENRGGSGDTRGERRTNCLGSRRAPRHIE